MKTMVEPGPELDAKVADAMGFPAYGYDSDYNWHPSTNVAQAFEAAELVGLFNYGSLEKVGDLWRFCSSAFPTRLQSSPALAICDGVIALVESRRESDA